jgi:hypothetical protein
MEDGFFRQLRHQRRRTDESNRDGQTRCCVKHPGILAERGERRAFATNAIFSRFPNEKREKPTFAKSF